MILFFDMTPVAGSQHRLRLFLNHYRLHQKQNNEVANGNIPKHKAKQTEQPRHSFRQVPRMQTVSVVTHEEVFTFNTVPTACLDSVQYHKTGKTFWNKYLLNYPISTALSTLLYQVTVDYQ